LRMIQSACFQRRNISYFSSSLTTQQVLSEAQSAARTVSSRAGNGDLSISCVMGSLF
jgi:hypothetical protein